MNSNETYKISEVIGQGSGGIVYKAIHTRLNKEVVIKQIKKANVDSIFNRQEVDLLKGLKHTYLPQVYDFIEENGEAYTVMDFIPGMDMDKAVKERGALRSKEVQRYAIQLCEAVKYLHSRKPSVIHSDIKPANIMLTNENTICLIDFNVSLMFDDENAEVLGGTPGYAPPEQLGIPLADIKKGISGELPIGKGSMYVDERSDIYSIGATMYYMLTGEKPAENYRCKPLADFGIRMSDGMLHIVRKAMSLDPAKRYRSADEMLTALKNIGKLDRRYRALKVRREVITIIAVVLLASGIALNRMGSQKLSEEHEEKYSSYITEIESLVAQGEAGYDSAEGIIDKAIKMEPNRLQPYLDRMAIMFDSKMYEECIAYPDQVLTPNTLSDEYNTDEVKARILFCAAESAYEIEAYDKAIELFSKTLHYSEDILDCYRDLGIAYAKTDDIENARKTLERAEKKGLSSDQLEQLRGEIYSKQGEYDKALECYEKVFALTEDDYIRYRAALCCDEIVKQAESEQVIRRSVEILAAGADKITAENYYTPVVEILMDENLKLSEMTGTDEGYTAAKEYGDILIKKQLANFQTLKNQYAICFDKLHDFQASLAVLDEAARLYPNEQDSYWTYMCYTFVYIDIEKAKPKDEAKDYTNAREAYKTAEALYKEFGKNGISDPNMDNLRKEISAIDGWKEF